MSNTGVHEHAIDVLSPAFVRPLDAGWAATTWAATPSAATPSAEDGACVGGGARVDGELLDEATLDLRERELTRLSAHMDAATHRQLTLIRLMDVSERWAQQGAKSCAAWLSWKIGLAPGPAREHVRVAKALAALPHIDGALRRGAISYSKVRAMTRVATQANERKLLDAALETTAAQLEKICRGLRQVQRHDGRPPEDDSPERHVRLRYRGDGTVGVEAVLLPDEAQRVMEALRLVRAAMRQEQAPELASAQPDLAGAQPDLADALTRIADDIVAGGVLAGGVLARGVLDDEHFGDDGLASGLVCETEARSPGNADRLSADTHALDGAGPRSRGDADRPRPRSPRTSGAERTQVIVHFTEDRIDGDHAAFLDDGSRLAPETFRRLACDCGLIGVREDHDGDPLDVGRKTRAIPPALRRAVMLRDAHCQFPGCTHDRHIDLHHIEHWVHGGETSKQNLIALCTFHHTMVHERGFTLERGGDGPRFLAPDRAVPLPRFHIAPPAPTDPLEAFERAHADLCIHDETGLTGWDGERVHYDDVVEVLTASDDPGAAVEPGHADEPIAAPPDDLHLPVRAWLDKHGLDG